MATSFDRVFYEIVLAVTCLGVGGLFSTFAASGPARLILLAVPYIAFLVLRVFYRKRTGREAMNDIIVWDKLRTEKEEQQREARIVASRIPKKLDLFWPTTFLIVGIALTLYGLLMVSAQIVGWLRYDAWVPVALIDIFLPHPLRGEGEPFVVSLIPDFFLGSESLERYLLNPPQGAWLGIRRIFLWTLKCPLALASCLIGIYVAILASSNLERIHLALRARQESGN
ncbi:MAG: hypothetical protein AABM64_10530 [Pseudomonadota bacterium]